MSWSSGGSLPGIYQVVEDRFSQRSGGSLEEIPPEAMQEVAAMRPRPPASPRQLAELKQELAEVKEELVAVQREKQDLAEVKQELVAMRRELAGLKQGRCQSQSPGPGPREDQDHEPTAHNNITPSRLDVGSSYTPHGSAWDAFLFVGHPGIGAANSFILFLVWLLNGILQAWFVGMMYFNVPLEGVTESVLNDLLRFRISTGHSAASADWVMKTSLVRDICETNEKLDVAGGQLGVLQDVRRFMRGGKELMVLAQLLWLFLIIKELEDIYQFCRAVLLIDKEQTTKIIIADSSQDSFDNDKYRANHTKETALSTLMVAVRVEYISNVRACCAVLLVALPRMVISLGLCYTGMMFLAQTTTHADLILNALAFAFVCDLDELIYECFAPFRVRTLMDNLEPIPTPREGKWGWLAGVQPVLKMCIVAAVLLLLMYFELWPRFWRMNQVEVVLCGGDPDFIYSKNVANDLIYVTKSSSNTEWQEDEKVILQVAGMPLENKYWSSLEDEISERASSSSMYAVALPYTGLADGGYTESNFDTVVELSYQSLEEAADKLSCKDLGTSDTITSSLRALRLLSGNMSLTDCSDIPWQWCSSSNYSQLRALCPVRCTCHYPVRYFRGYSGYFQSSAGGCPGQCKVLVASFNQIYHATSPMDELQGYIPCSDVGAGTLVFQGGCTNTDIFTMAFNSDGWSCVAYYYYYYDYTGDCSEADDTDFTASDMCCACGGGTTDVSTSESCAANFSDNCENMNFEAFSLLIYLRGLFETLLADPGFEDTVTQIVKHPSNLVAVPYANQTALIEWVTSGSMPQSILSGSWEMLPGVPHPRGLTGCAFLTSFEITALLNTDLCSAEAHASIKPLCPESCGCTLGTFYRSENGSGTELFEELNLTVKSFTLKAEDLADCPASCVIPHPDYSGDTSFSSWELAEYYYYDD